LKCLLVSNVASLLIFSILCSRVARFALRCSDFFRRSSLPRCSSKILKVCLYFSLLKCLIFYFSLIFRCVSASSSAPSSASHSSVAIPSQPALSVPSTPARTPSASRREVMSAIERTVLAPDQHSASGQSQNHSHSNSHLVSSGAVLVTQQQPPHKITAQTPNGVHADPNSRNADEDESAVVFVCTNNETVSTSHALLRQCALILICLKSHLALFSQVWLMMAQLRGMFCRIKICFTFCFSLNSDLTCVLHLLALQIPSSRRESIDHDSDDPAAAGHTR